MSGPLVSASAAFVAKNSRIPPFAIEQSLRFSTDEFLTRTNSSNATDGQYGTLSVWYKMDSTTAASQLRTIIEGANGTYGHQFRFYQGQTDLHIGVWGSVDGGAYSNAQFRDDSAWYHFLWQFDKTQSGVTNVNKLWVNGVAQTQSSAGNFSSQNWGVTNNGSTVRIGHYQGNGSTQYARLKGYIAEMHVIDGSLKAATDFGEYDDNGVWRPIEVSGLTYGTNGFYLKFDPTATNGIGHDHSGNGNNFTANNFITSGTGTDVMSDTPTTNYCTLNPLDTGGATLSNGNLVHTTPSTGYGATRGTIGVSSGKWYWEVEPTSLSGGVQLGILGVIQKVDTSTQIGGQVTGYSYINNGDRYGSGSYTVGWGDSFTTGDVIGVALDMDAGDIEFFKNGTSQGTAFTGLSGTFAPALSDNSNSASSAFIYNFGQRAFEYTPPTGYKALNTSNLSAPEIADGSQYFNAVAYSGNSSTQSIAVGFQPDFLWLKSRTQGYSHWLVDSIRGTYAKLSSDSPNGENTDTTKNPIEQFTSTGFDLQYTADDGLTYSDVNASGQNYIAWNWLAGGTGSSNTDGSITSTVSANPSAGFSIVSYTGTGANATVGHGLGVAPAMMIIKDRDAQTRWIVYHQTQGNAGYLRLDDTAAFNSDLTVFNSTSPSSTVFSVGTSANTNPNGNDVIAYCFAEVEGYSKFGSYTGNGSTDGVFIHLGFKPKFFLLKATSVDLESWSIFDSARDPDNFVNRRIMPNNANEEEEYPNTGQATMDFLANGVKLRASNTAMNGSGVTYIYVAFAENPMGGSGVSPATAR